MNADERGVRGKSEKGGREARSLPGHSFPRIGIDLPTEGWFRSKIEQQPNFVGRGPKVIQQLSFVIIGQLVDCFKLHNHRIFDQKICIVFADILTMKTDFDLSLRLNAQTHFPKGYQHRILINLFEKPVSQLRIYDFKEGMKDLICDLTMFQV